MLSLNVVDWTKVPAVKYAHALAIVFLHIAPFLKDLKQIL